MFLLEKCIFFFGNTKTRPMQHFDCFEAYGASRLHAKGIIPVSFPHSSNQCLMACLDAMECGELDKHAKDEHGRFFWSSSLEPCMWTRLCALRPRLDLFWSMGSNLRLVRIYSKREYECIIGEEYWWQDLSVAQAFADAWNVTWVKEEVSKRWQCCARRAWILAVVLKTTQECEK